MPAKSNRPSENVATSVPESGGVDAELRLHVNPNSSECLHEERMALSIHLESVLHFESQ